jgi:hypothetical protein
LACRTLFLYSISNPAVAVPTAVSFFALSVSMNLSNNNITVGRYLVSPLPKQLECGQWASSVSIRSGTGSHTHDRVLRLNRLFRDQLAAAEHGLAEGLQWIGHRQAGAANPTV